MEGGNVEEYRDYVLLGVHKASFALGERLSIDEFDGEVSAAVSADGYVPSNHCDRICKAVHWELFCNGEDLARYAQPKKSGERPRVELARGFYNSDVERVADSILEKHADYLTA